MPETPAQSVHSTRIRKALILLIILACLGVAAVSMLERAGQFDISIVLDSPWLMHAVLLQFLGIYLFILAWYLLLGTQHKIEFTLAESTAHIGITLLGKYIPGKVWGLLGRAYLLTTRGVTPETAAQLLLLDQFLTFYTGLTIGAVALVIVMKQELGILLLLAAVLVSPLVVRSNVAVLTWILGWLGRKISRWRLDSELRSETTNGPQPLKALAVYFLHWLAISIVLCLLYYPALEPELLNNCLLLIASIPLAMLSGFVALWAPGGIGVREAVIVGILSLSLTFEIAVSIAITYRFICVFNDLVTGAFAFYYYSKHPQALAEA